ncbi:hypothetical protein EPO15_01920, partial [bacterium]
MSLLSAAAFALALRAGAAEREVRPRAPARVLVEAASSVGRGGPTEGGPVGDSGPVPGDVALATAEVAGVPSAVDLSVLQAPTVPSESDGAVFGADLGAAALHDPQTASPAAPAPAPARARPASPASPFPTPSPAAAGGALVAAALFWPFWKRLNVQDVETTPFRAPRPTRPTSAPDYLAEAEEARLLGGRYELRRLIGRGGMAQVWEGFDKAARRPAAVKKIIIPEGPRAESRRQLALQEARTLVTLRHPNVVDFYEVLEIPTGLYLV